MGTGKMIQQMSLPQGSSDLILSTPMILLSSEPGVIPEHSTESALTAGLLSIQKFLFCGCLSLCFRHSKIHSHCPEDDDGDTVKGLCPAKLTGLMPIGSTHGAAGKNWLQGISG